MSEADVADDGLGRRTLKPFLFPGQSSDAPRSLALACVLGPTAVVPAGYALVVAKAALGHRPRPSNLTLNGTLIRDGAAVVGVVLCYLLPGIAVAVLEGPPAVAGALLIVAGYLLPAAVVIVGEQDARAALRVSFIIDVALTGSYLRTAIGSAGLVAVAGLLLDRLAARTSPGAAAVLGVFVVGYLVLVISYRHALQYDELRDRGRTVDHGSTGVPV